MRSPALLALVLALPTGCETRPDEQGASPPPLATQVAPSLRIEQVERSLETGRGVDDARQRLTDMLQDPALEPGDRDRALLARSRVAEAEGKNEDAVRDVEQVMASHADGRPWSQEAAAEARLRKLLTGASAVPRAVRDRERWPVAPFAHALGRFFPENASHEVTVRLVRYGGSVEASDRLGTFNVGGALGDERHAACPLCEDQRPTHTLSSSGSWTALPRTATLAGESLEVFAFDLEEERIPARYDARLPLPSADVVARLERGEGVIAVKLRGEGPPSILLGAPRWSQLAAVEAVLASMTELPASPVRVPVSQSLLPDDIQAVVRASFGRFRVCYEELLLRSPRAAGTVALDFAVMEDGSVDAPAIAETSTLREGAMDACMLGAVRSLRFPRGPGRTTVTYPVSFSP